MENIEFVGTVFSGTYASIPHDHSLTYTDLQNPLCSISIFQYVRFPTLTNVTYSTYTKTLHVR